MDKDIKVNKNVFSARLLNKLHSGIGVRSSTKLEVLVKFDNDESFDNFLANQTTISNSVNATGNKRYKVIRASKSVRVVSLEIRLDVLGSLSIKDKELGIKNVDENFRVRMSLDKTHAIEMVHSAWNLGFHGQGVKVAVLDTGIDSTHPDLSGVVIKHENFSSDKNQDDAVGHGTHVASIIAGRGKVDITKKGLADGCELFDGKVLASDGFGKADDTIAGIEWAVAEGADIINMSLGASGAFDGTDALSEAANWAVTQGVTVCAAAGNCGPEGNTLECQAIGDKTIDTPGCAAFVITVGAVDKFGKIAGYSSRGPTWGNIFKPDVVTVGSDIVAARANETSMGVPVDGHYTKASGTSMATPVCSGLIALILEIVKSKNQKLKPEEIKKLLQNSALSIDGAREKDQGAGFIEMERILSFLEVQPMEVFKVESFTPLGGTHRAGESLLWFLTLNNTTEDALFDVTATFVSNQIEIEMPAKSFGTIEKNGTERVGYTLSAKNDGVFNMKLNIEYKTKPEGELLKVEKNIKVSVEPKVVIVSEDRLNIVLNDAVNKLLDKQNNNGTWAGDIMFNVWTNAMYAILHKAIGLDGIPTEVLDWIEANRTGQDVKGKPDGTWGIVDDPSLHMLETTVLSEIALEIWGRDRNQDAWDFIDQQATSRLASAISLADPFTQLFSAIASLYTPPGIESYYSVHDILAPPIEMLLVPRFAKNSLHRLFAAWGQDGIPALMVITTVMKEKNIPLAKQIFLKRVESILLRSQNEDGSWYGTALPSIACTMAMHFLGYSNTHEVMIKAVKFLKSLQRSDGYMARFRLPVWDTGLAILALRNAGVDAHNHQLRSAGLYLMDSQNFSGGIPFQKENISYPDTDDTSIAILALSDLDMDEKEGQKKAIIEKGLRWLLYMHSNDGGWAAFAKNQAKKTRGKLPFFKDDPSTADVTGHVLSSLKLASEFGYTKAAEEAIKGGVRWIKKMQMDSGEWFGRWGLTYTYGITAVLQGLYDIGESMDQTFIQDSVDYLLQTQHSDGGWGEGFATYYNSEAKDITDSTIEQTAWSLLGLLVTPKTARVDDAINRGVNFLLNRYDMENGWGNGQYTVGALWIYKNTLYPLLWSIWAIGLYKNQKGV